MSFSLLILVILTLQPILGSAWYYHLFHKNIKDAVKEADLITTLTPSTEAYINVLDLKEDCHINAVGADAEGKRELRYKSADQMGRFFDPLWVVRV